MSASTFANARLQPNTQKTLPGFSNVLQSIHAAIDGVDGWLSRREVEFLATVAACPTAQGDILEIGSFRGRSTIVLALAQRFAKTRFECGSRVSAVDPMLDDDPLLDAPGDAGSARAEFDRNLRRAKVDDEIDFQQAFSYEIAPSWTRPLRMLWIDGDHSYPSTIQDYSLFAKHLTDGAILAMHDVLSRYDGCIRVFCENVLTSPHFGAAGICGSIGWAQYWVQPQHDPAEQARKKQLLGQLQRLLPYHTQQASPRGLEKLRYKWLRSRVPHQAIRPSRWLGRVKCIA